MALSQVGQDVVEFIFKQINNGIISDSSEIRLKALNERTGHSCQNIGLAFDSYIKEPLAAKGYEAKKCGRPVRIILKKRKNG